MTEDDDALLTAFADNALGAEERGRLQARLADEAGLRARLVQIVSGGRPFAPALDALLDEAPMARLRASLAALPADRPQKAMKPWIAAVAAAAAAVFFIGGFAAGRFAPLGTPTQEAGESRDDWRHAVAAYMALYTADTLSHAPGDAASQAAELTALGERLGLSLTPDNVAVAGLPFKRTELLSYDKAPLGQLAYLDPEAGPVLFCIIADARPDAPVSNAAVDGFATSSWAKGGRGFMVIGRLPAARAAAIAGHLRQQL